MRKGLVVGISVLFLSIFVIGFVSAFSFSDFWNKLTGHTINETTNQTIPTESPVICEDSDNGLNYDTYGQVYTQGNTAPSVIDSCSSSSVLSEGYCVTNGATTQSYTCPYGCSAGKCNSAPVNQTSPSNVSASCTDSDEGLTYSVKGEVSTNGVLAGTDTCQNNIGPKLFEHYCDNSNNDAYASYTCPYGCSSGKCNSAPINQTTINSTTSTCISNCSFTGQKQCFGFYLQTCGNYDADNCLEFDSGTYCPYGCSNGVCNSVPTNQTTNQTNSTSVAIITLPVSSVSSSGGSSGGGGGGSSGGSSTTEIESANQMTQKEIPVYINSNTASYPTPSISIEQAVANSDLVIQQINNISIGVELDKMIYSISGTKEGRLLTILPVKVEIKQRIDANSGETLSTDKPWWAFLVFWTD